MSKLENLQKLKSEIIVKNKEKYPKGERNVVIANHNCLMDIFYLPYAIPEEIVSLVSARLVYKQELDRKEVVHKYLNAMPIEAHGGAEYTRLCLEQAKNFLELGKSVNIFPEGAYVLEQNIFRGHTGASRLVYETNKILNNGERVNLIPVSIYVKRNDDLDNYKCETDYVEVTFLDRINYEESYYKYQNTTDKVVKNTCLHKPIDTAMKNIANNLGLTYVNEYIKLRPKGNVMFADGSVVDVLDAQNEEYLNRYKDELDNQALKLIKKMS